MSHLKLANTQGFINGFYIIWTASRTVALHIDYEKRQYLTIRIILCYIDHIRKNYINCLVYKGNPMFEYPAKKLFV